MDWSTTILVGFTLGVVFFLVCCRRYSQRGIPPGPAGVPFFGYSLFLGKYPQNTLKELSLTYGNVFSLYLGNQLTIILNDHAAIHAAFSAQAEIFSGRAAPIVFTKLNEGYDGKAHGISINEGDLHRTARRFALQNFRDLGLGKQKLQHQIVEEIEHLINLFTGYNGRSFDPAHLVASSVANVISTLCFGKRFDHSDPDFVKHLDGARFETGIAAHAGLIRFFPWLRHIPFSAWSRAWSDIGEHVRRSGEFLRGKVAEHKETYDGSETRDYIDAFLKEQAKQREIDGSVKPAFEDVELVQNLRVFFSAGTDTTSLTILWAFLFLLHHPEIQRKIHKELDDNFELDQIIYFEDRGKLPYVEAFLREVQRLANVIPFGVPRMNIEETMLLGYRIPKRCVVLPNILAIHTDPAALEDPLDFKPERFLDKEGRVRDHPEFVPFSLGRRACLGEGLVRIELLLFFANIFKRMEIEVPIDCNLPPTNESITKSSNSPLPFEMIAVLRQPGVAA